MSKIVQFILDRAAERSTWLGLISVATALGLLLNQTQQDAIIAAGMAAGGLVAAFTKDKTS